jgi:MATE family multidrug resistance protein
VTGGLPPRERAPWRELVGLCLPIVGVNLGMMLMGTIDTLMVGRVSAAALAAVAIGNVYFNALAMFCLGVLLALDPVVSQALGAGDVDRASIAVQRGVVLALILTVPLTAMMVVARPIVAALDQPVDVVPLIATYCTILAPSVLPFLLFTVGRQTLQAMQRVGPVLWTIAIANAVNVGLNQWLIFGGLGVPPLGVAGSAWAPMVWRFLMVAQLAWLARHELGALLGPWHAAATEWPALARFFRLGLPIGLQLEIEMGTFATVAFLMGSFGTVPVAGHQIALNLASLTFMVPMGVGMAAAVMVGRAVGRADPAALRRSATAALALGAGFMACTAAALLTMPGWLSRLYSTDPAVVAFATMLLPIAGVFQVFDGLQVVSGGILRGVGDTRSPMVVNLFGFVGIGLSVSIYLAFRTPLGAVGLWWGLVIGLAVVALVLLIRVRHVLRRPIDTPLG